jgi:hypothetical protein
MDAKGVASEKGLPPQPPSKQNSKDGVDEGKLTRVSHKGSVGYAPPLDTIGDTGGPQLTRSNSTPYDLWQGLGEARETRKRPIPAAEGTTEAKTQTDAVDVHRGDEEENDASSEESVSPNSSATHHSAGDKHQNGAFPLSPLPRRDTSQTGTVPRNHL